MKQRQFLMLAKQIREGNIEAVNFKKVANGSICPEIRLAELARVHQDSARLSEA